MTQHESDQDVRQSVSEAYERALARSQTRTTSCCGGPKAAGNAAKLVDYQDDAQGLPQQAVASSFGCGNPLAFSQVQLGEVVLDLGSGAGLDLLIAAKKVGSEGRVIGVDMTDAMIAAARSSVEQARLHNVEIRKGVIEDLPVEDASVDWVISNCVINLSPDKPQVFREIARVLKPGGHFSVSDIVVDELPDALRQHAALRSACIGGAISEVDYKGGLEAAGLVEVEVTERLLYDKEQLLAVVTLDDAVSEGLTPEFIETATDAASGKVWSAKFTGQKPLA